MNCAHPGCHCSENNVGNGFCSEHCANAGQRAGSGPCNCGHPDCKD
jgi:hypothetical protein